MKVLLLWLIIGLTFHAASAQDNYRALVKKADLVIKAEIVDVYPSMGFWSGLIPSIQSVEYKVIEVLKGKFDAAEIVVGHNVVANSKTADPGHPRLSKEIFKEGNVLMLFIEATPKSKKYVHKYLVPSENEGAFINDESSEEAVRKAIKN